MQPTFLIDYPVELSPLAKQQARRPDITSSASSRSSAASRSATPTRSSTTRWSSAQRFELQARLRAAGDDEAELIDEDFLNALEHGMPPTGGLGVGIDRLVMLLSGKRSIREVILFPTLREKR